MKIKPNKDGLISVHRRKSKQNEATKMAEKFFDDKLYLSFSADNDKNLSDSEGKKKAQKAKEKKHKNKKKIKAYCEQLDTSNRQVNIGKLLSKIFINYYHIRVVGNKVYIYDDKAGLFKLSDEQRVSTLINSWIDKERDDSNKFASKDNDEAYRYLITNASIQKRSIENAYNKPYVLCKNGVLELPTMKLLPFSHKYGFTTGIHAKYDENSSGKLFKEFIEYATDGDKDLKCLIQEIMGYALSNYTNIRKAFVFAGPTGTGKSTILDVIRHLVGEEMACEVSLKKMEEEYYGAKVLSSVLNIVPDHDDKTITDVARFKSLVSDSDVVSGRNPFEKPFAQRCRTKMLFGTNHFFHFSGVTDGDLEAFFDRIIYVPFDREIKKKVGSFWSVLKVEYDYIFTWAMKGLKRLIEHGFVFTPLFSLRKNEDGCCRQMQSRKSFL